MAIRIHCKLFCGFVNIIMSIKSAAPIVNYFVLLSWMNTTAFLNYFITYNSHNVQSYEFLHLCFYIVVKYNNCVMPEQ